MRRYVQTVGLGMMLAFSGPCFPDNYWSSLLSTGGVAVFGALLSDVLNTFFPAV